MAIAAIRSVTGRMAQTALNLCGGKSRVYTVNGEKALERIKWIGEHISTPENRLILGISALMSQPFIDAANKNVDEKTRRYSVARTIAKIIAGTVTGVTIRKLCIKAVDAFTVENITAAMKHPKLRQCLLPTIEHTAEQLKQYKNTVGSLAALGVMLFTNFLIDVPLTKYLTNKFVKMTEGKDAKVQ